MTSRVAGATNTASTSSSAERSPSQSVITSAWDAQRTASGVMILCADGVMMTVSSAPWRLNSLASLTVSTAAIPPVTPRTIRDP